MSQSVSPEPLSEVPADVLAAAEAESPGGEAVPETVVRGDRVDGPSLWRDGNFLTMWTGQSLSQFGAQVTELAVPVLAVLLLHATEFEVGVLNAAGVAAFLLVGLPAGAWIDRLRKRSVMIWADAVRAASLAVVPVLWLTGSLQIWHLYAVALVLGVATVFFDVSYQSIIPSLVRSDQIAQANGKLESTQQLAGLAGPGFGGWLVGAISAPFAIVATVGTYVASFIALSLTRDHEVVRERSDHEPILREIGEGLRWVFGNPLLRRIVATTGISNLFSTLTFTLVPIFYLRILGFTPATMGLLFSASALGGLAAAMLTARIVARIGESRAIPISAIGFSLTSMLLPLAASVPPVFAFPLLVVEGVIASFMVLLYNITQVTFRQRITPPRLLGRMNASIRFCVWGVMPLAALTAGVLGEWLGVVPTLWIGALGALTSALPVAIGPFWRTRGLPVP